MKNKSRKSVEAGFWNNKSIVKQFSHDRPSSHLIRFLSDSLQDPNATILDLGCGAGRNTAMMVSREFNVYACDTSRAMLNATREKMGLIVNGKQVQIRTCNMMKLPYNADSFDLVVANGVLHNAKSLLEYRKAIKEIGRVLKAEGFLYINTFCQGNFSGQQSKLKIISAQEHVYLTEAGLKMVLVSQNDLLRMLGDVGLFPFQKILSYQKRLPYGYRS